MEYRPKYLSSCLRAIPAVATSFTRKVRGKRARLAVMVPFAALLYNPASAQVAPDLGAAESFAVLADTAVTCTRSAIDGDVGVVLPTGFTDTGCTITGTLHEGADAVQAYGDFLDAYVALASTPCGQTLTTLDGQTLSPGVYCFDAAATSTGGVLTLVGSATDIWVFKIGTAAPGALTGTNFSVIMEGGGQPRNVYWWVDAAATMTDSFFLGNILAGASITVTRGCFDGRALAEVAVTLTDTVVSADCSFAGPPGAASLLIIDEDSIDNGTRGIERISFNAPFCGGRNPARCVNDDIADPGVRTLLFTRGLDITPYSGLVLPTGQVGDEGLFRFTKPDPQLSNQNGETFTRREFINATGAAEDENNLDKIDGVAPMRAAAINALVGKTVCAVVYDSDVSVTRNNPPEASLKGATLGLTAFRVTGVSPHPAGGSYLPLITVHLLWSKVAELVCGTSNEGAPGSPTVTSVIDSGGILNVAWLPGPGFSATSYRLDFYAGDTLLARMNVGATPAVAIPLTAGIQGTFGVRVTAINGAVATPASALFAFTIGAPCTPPASPNLSGGVAGGTASVTWTPVAGATLYVLSAGTTQGGTQYMPATNLGTNTGVSASGLPAGFTAWVRVVAVNACGQESAPADLLVR